MQALSAPELLIYLGQQGLISHPSEVKITAMDGGVSSMIHRVETSERSFVVKQALEKLRVRDDWRCDPSRNLHEQDFMAVADELLPDSVPRLFFCDRDRALFVMEYLDSGWTTWKSRLWAGEFSGEIAEQVGGLLGSLHRNAWGRKDLARQFDNLALFHELRVAPYLLTAAQRHPDLASPLESEARRLDETRITLVHGDYSPKNLMTDGKRVKILDAEVACFGDPAFDIAFVLNHLLLKAVRFPEHFHAYATLRDTFIHAYRVAVADCWSGELEVRSAKLVLMLMLARIAGKSPVEYFDAESPEAKRIVRFVSNQLTDLTDHFNFSQLNCHFQNVFLHNHTH